MFDPVKELGIGLHEAEKWIKGWRLDKFFVDAFNKAEKLYQELTDLEKQVAQQASGIIAVISANLSGLPDFVFDIIQNYFPALTKEQLLNWLASINAIIAGASSYLAGTFEEELVKIQGYLSKNKSSLWISDVSRLFDLFVIVINPSTILQKIQAIREWVYNTFWRGQVQVAVA